MKLLRNEHGSTLLLVVITIAVLSILGTTILSMSFMNYNMQFSDAKMKKTLYYSESGVEQVYALIGRHVDDALFEASDLTTIALDAEEAKVEFILNGLSNQYAAMTSTATGVQLNMALHDTLFSTDYATAGLTEAEYLNRGLYLKVFLKTNEDYVAYYDGFLTLEDTIANAEIEFVKLINPTYTTNTPTASENLNQVKLYIDKVKIESKSKDYFNQFYMDYLDEVVTPSLGSPADPLSTQINSVYNYLDDNNESVLNADSTPKNKSTITHSSISKFSDVGSVDVSGNKIMVVNDLQSTFLYNNDTRKTISTNIVIRQPGDAIPLTIASNRILVKSNPLWQYALISHEDITMNSVDMSIKGPVYALGTRANSTLSERIESSANEGFVLYGSSNVEVDGDVISHSYVQIGNDADGANLTINKGQVYANSFVTQESSEDSSMLVNGGNVYTRDDLELNGDRNSITINGSYYGFMGTAAAFDETSAIVINADLTTSKLKITGESTAVNYPDQYSGIFIAGVSSVKDQFLPNPSNDGSSLYQTGESIGIKGNYLAYAFTSDDPVDEFHESKLGGIAVGQNTNIPLYYENSSGVKLGAETKARYFNEIVSNPLYSSLFTFGGSNLLITNTNMEYSVGSYISGNSARLPIDGGAGITSYKDEFLEKDIARDYIYIMNYLTHRPDTLLTHDILFPAGNNIVNSIKDDNKAKVIKNYSRLIGGSFDYAANDIRVATEPLNGINATEVAIVKSNGGNTSNILLRGSGATIPVISDEVTFNSKVYKVITDVSGEMQGIIMTEGEVLIDGDLDFYGTIIAVGDITIGNPNLPTTKNNVNIYNSDNDTRRYLAELVLTDSDLVNVLRDDPAIEPFITGNSSIPISLEDVEYVKDIVFESGDVDYLRQNYDDFIYYMNWSIVE